MQTVYIKSDEMPDLGFIFKRRVNSGANMLCKNKTYVDKPYTMIMSDNRIFILSSSGKIIMEIPRGEYTSDNIDMVYFSDIETT